MPEFTSPLSSLLHPHQIEVQEFDSYALVIDARPPAEYEEDHLPGAVNLPVVPVAVPSDAASNAAWRSRRVDRLRRLEGAARCAGRVCVASFTRRSCAGLLPPWRSGQRRLG